MKKVISKQSLLNLGVSKVIGSKKSVTTKVVPKADVPNTPTSRSTAYKAAKAAGKFKGTWNEFQAKNKTKN